MIYKLIKYFYKPYQGLGEKTRADIKEKQTDKVTPVNEIVGGDIAVVFLLEDVKLDFSTNNWNFLTGTVKSYCTLVLGYTLFYTFFYDLSWELLLRFFTFQ